MGLQAVRWHVSLLALALWLAGIFGGQAFWQSRDSNYNQNIVSGGACSGWTPATPSGLIGWYNADPANVSPNTNGATVTVMTDLSGGAHDMAPNGFTGPVYNTTGLGGKPALVFAGGNATGMRTSTDVVTLGTGATSSIFMLANFTTSSNEGPYIAGNGQVVSPGAGANSYLLELNDAGFIIGDQNFGQYASTTAAINTELRIGFIWDGTNATGYINNVAGTPQAHSFNFTTPGSLGAARGNYAGALREIIFYNTALGSPDRACMDAYLVSRQ